MELIFFVIVIVQHRHAIICVRGPVGSKNVIALPLATSSLLLHFPAKNPFQRQQAQQRKKKCNSQQSAIEEQLCFFAQLLCMFIITQFYNIV
jgi:hypothetical protein